MLALLDGSSVAGLAGFVGAASTEVSQRLANLRPAGLIRGRREGTFVQYYTDRGPPGRPDTERAHTHIPAPPAGGTDAQDNVSLVWREAARRRAGAGEVGQRSG
jgi:hypothetical protein